MNLTRIIPNIFIMFSDRYRLFKISAIAMTLLLLLAYAYSQGGEEITFSKCLASPRLWDGKKVPIYMEARIMKVRPDRIRISQSGGPVDIWIPPHFNAIIPRGTQVEDLKPGQFLEAITVFHRDRGGYLELKKIRVAPLRKLKIAVSIFPVIIIVFFLARYLRWEKGGLVIRE